MTLPDFAIANAVLAVPLAALAVAGSLIRRPAVAHALWLLVLLRLFAPPVWRVPLPEWPIRGAAPVEAESPVGADLGAEPEWDGNAEPEAPVTETPAPAPVIAAVVVAVAEAPKFTWRKALAVVWGAGVLAVLGLATVRVSAFSRLLRHAEPAPASWQRTCDRLAHRLGLWRRPKVWLVRGPVSPLLWAGFGRPRVLLPAALAERLDGARRAALLAHELAHLRRGDHLVRWLELAATAVYWWHPVVWLARRGLREVEEQCCDAWVVWALPAARRAYADALVDTVDFLSCARPILPPLASGLGTVRHLQRRVVMIMRGTVSPRLSRPGLLTSLVVGVALLAIAPGWGQLQPEPPRPRNPAPAEEERVTEDERLDRRRAAEADELRQMIRQLHAKLNEAEKRLADVEGRPAPQPARRTAGGPKADEPRLPRRFGPQTDSLAPLPPAPPALPVPPVPPTPSAAPYPPAGIAPTLRTPPGVPGAPPTRLDAEASTKQDRRLRDLEKSLADLRREIAEMRREMRRPPGDGN